MIISGCLSPLQQFLRNGPLERDRRHSTCTRRLVSFTRGGTTYLIRTRPSKYCTLSPKYLYTHFQSLISSVPSVKSFYDFFSRTFLSLSPHRNRSSKITLLERFEDFHQIFFSPFSQHAAPRVENKITLTGERPIPRETPFEVLPTRGPALEHPSCSITAKPELNNNKVLSRPSFKSAVHESHPTRRVLLFQPDLTRSDGPLSPNSIEHKHPLLSSTPLTR